MRIAATPLDVSHKRGERHRVIVEGSLESAVTGDCHAAFGEGPTEKGLLSGHLAGGLLHSWVNGLPGGESPRGQ